MFPRTIPGRVISFILCIWGVFITSLFVVTLTNYITLSQAELKALKLYEKLEARENMEYHAGKAVYFFCRMLVAMKRLDHASEQRALQALEQMMVHISEFKKCKGITQSSAQGMMNKSDLVSMVENLHKSMNRIKVNQKKFMEFNENTSKRITEFYRQK